MLVVVVFPLANNFCFQGIFDSLTVVNVAQAASKVSDNGIVNKMADMDNCSQEPVKVNMGKSSVVELTAAPVPVTGHENSVLPCCVDGNHPSVITSSQSVEIQKFVTTAFYSDEQILKVVFANTIYNNPIFLPPKLLAVSTTILRL